MSISSNLYAEKIFSEHPIAIWPLDDSADYISLITEADRDMTNAAMWTITGGTAFVVNDTGKFIDSILLRIDGDDPGENPTGTVTLVSKDIAPLNTVGNYNETFAIATNFMSQSADITSIEIGVRYNNPGEVDDIHTIAVATHNQWLFASHTFDSLPYISSNFKIVIKVNYNKSETAGATYRFQINGLSIGRNAEEFHRESLGVSAITIPSTIDLPSLSGVEAVQYGMPGNIAYYLVDKNYLRARNFGVPLVYGSDSSTTLVPNYFYVGEVATLRPSMIVPGLGFLSEGGQYQERTLEAWIRINNGSSAYASEKVIARKIIGPINSEDGLYVDGPFLSLKIGNVSGSHFVGEWGRPMLIDIRIASDSASLLVNGEEVISLFYKTGDLNLLPKINPSTGKDQDWIGFYTPQEIQSIQVDAITIYPYVVPEVMAKRRFVYGQGVEFPNNINASYNTTSMVPDYQFANYANNYSYPDLGTWEIGILENLQIDGKSISTPRYSLPIVKFSNRSLSEWYTDLKLAQTSSDYFMTLKPNASWDPVGGYMLFEDFNTLNQDLHAFYATFQKTGTETSKQTLLKIYSNTHTNYFEVSISGNDVKYEIHYNNVTYEISEMAHTVTSETFAVGFDLNTVMASYGYNLQAFFGNKNSLRMLVGGNINFEGTFTGKIHSVGFCTEKNLYSIKSLFDSATGEIIHSSDMTLVSPSYKLILKDTLSGFSLDVFSHSSWKEYIPLSYFSKYVSDPDENKYYSMDLLQFNISYPEPESFIATSYLNVAEETVPITAYNTSSSLVKTYITFESLNYTANRLDTNFKATVPAASNGVVAPGADWANSRYEVVNGSIIYPPTGVDIQTLSIAVQIEFEVAGVVSTPVKIKKLHLSSLALDDVAGHSLGSRFGVPVRPYTKLGVYMDYKKRNPFRIYKGTSPYLYLTRQSGFRLRGDQKIGISRGLTMPINLGKSSAYKVGAIQLSIRFEDQIFPETPVEVFELESADTYIKFYLVASDPKRDRGRIYAINTATGTLQPELEMFLNGRLTSKTLINTKEWYVLGIQLGSKPDFANISGAFRITGPISATNVSHYQYTASQEQQSSKTRLWSAVAEDIGPTLWDYWTDFTWRDVLLTVTTERKAIDPGTIYKIYTGTNKIEFSDDKSLSLVNEQHRFYTGVSWQSQTLNAV